MNTAELHTIEHLAATDVYKRQLLTIMVSTVPIKAFNSCSIIIGTRSARSILFVKRCCCCFICFLFFLKCINSSCRMDVYLIKLLQILPCKYFLCYYTPYCLLYTSASSKAITQRSTSFLIGVVRKDFPGKWSFTRSI